MQNLYRARLATQERPCFVCSKFTSVVLTSADDSNTDWFYVCRSHLGDRNFCTRIGGEPQPTSRPTSPKKKLDDREPESDSVKDLISAIGSAWSSWRNSSKSDGTDKDKEKQDGKAQKDDDEKPKDKDNKTENDNAYNSESHSTPTTPVPTSPKQPPKPIQFILQRDYYYLRQREYTRRMQKKEAGQRLERLQFPQVPKERPVAK